MAIARINTENIDINSSLQIGDELYYSCGTVSSTGFMMVGDPTLLGVVSVITNDYIDFTASNITSPCQGVGVLYLSFKKDCSVNSSGLKGYFARITLTNTDHSEKNELFTIGSQVSLSSK